MKTRHIPLKFGTILLALSQLISPEALALVDYSEVENATPNRPRKAKVVKRSNPNKVSSSQVRTSSRSSYRPSGMFDLEIGYTTVDLDTASHTGKVNVTEFNGHFETGASIYFDAKYWMADSNDVTLSQSGSTQTGNPEVTMGFNWLAFGSGGNMTNIDLLLGARFKASDSELGSTRTDKIIGVNTVKGFNQFALGLGYKLYMTGTPDKETELVIGNIQKLTATFGWMVSNDIQFELEGAAWKINAGESTVKPNVLAEGDSFGVITPQLGLKLAPMVKLNLGASFVSSRSKQKDVLTGANLWDINGLYGSSIHAALNISI